MITKENLQELYYNQKLSIRQIAAKFGCTYNNVHYRFKKFELKPRKASENRPIKGSKFKELNDKEWLHQKYEVEQLSTNTIGGMLGCNSNTVKESLDRLGFKRRNLRESIINKSTGSKLILNTEVINGILLGDACMYRGKTEISMPSISHCSKHLEYAKHMSNILFGDESRVFSQEVKQHYKGRFSTHSKHNTTSLSDDRLLPTYQKWYNNRTKVIPNDLIITPKTLLYWFMDDGSSCQRRKESQTKQVYIVLCTEGFTKEENKLLADKLLNLDLKARVTPVKWGHGFRLRISQGQYSHFLDAIGPCPVRCFDYKWK